MTDAISRTAARYDDDGDGRLAAATLARLRWRARRGGKRCPKCQETKPVSEFGANATRQDGLSVYCRSCRSET